MSEIETHAGKLIPMDLEGATLEDRAKEACLKLSLKKEDQYHNSWLDCLKDEGYDKVLVYGGVIYDIQDVDHTAKDVAEATVNPDGTIDYLVSFYNGGAGFNEVLESAIKKAGVKKVDLP